MLDKGYVQMYTGNGKGKTTAALGLAFRAAGAGLKTMMIQFMKGQHYSELETSKMLRDYITIEQYGSAKFCMPDGNGFEEHYDLCRKGLARSMDVLKKGGHSIVILDEIITTLLFKLITPGEIISIIKEKPEKVELVLTGRGTPEELYQHCHLITEMREIKHYYASGVQSRKGIEN